MPQMFQYCHILVVHWIHFLFHSFCRPLAGSIVNFKIPLFRKTLFRRSTYQSHYTRFDSGLGIKGPGMPTFRRCITCKYIIFKQRSFFLLFCFWSKLSITIIYLSNFHELIFLVGGGVIETLMCCVRNVFLRTPPFTVHLYDS